MKLFDAYAGLLLVMLTVKALVVFMLALLAGLSLCVMSIRNRYVALKGSTFAYYESKEVSYKKKMLLEVSSFSCMMKDFINGRPINTLEMGLTAVKPDMSGKYRFVITTNRKKEYL